MEEVPEDEQEDQKLKQSGKISGVAMQEVSPKNPVGIHNTGEESKVQVGGETPTEKMPPI